MGHQNRCRMSDLHQKRRQVRLIHERLKDSSWGLFPYNPHHTEHSRYLEPVARDVDENDSASQAVTDRIHPCHAVAWDSRRRCALQAALARRAPPDVVRALVDATPGSALAYRDKSGWNSLMLTLRCYVGPQEEDNGEDDMPDNSIEMVHRILEKCGPEQVFACNHQGVWPLHYVLHAAATRWNGRGDDLSMDLVKLLLRYDAERQILLRNRAGENAVHIAIQHRLPLPLLRVLIQACPRALTAPCHSGFTPLLLAISENSVVSVIELLVESNPSTTRMPDAAGSYPLRLAVLDHQRLPLAQLIRLLCTSPETVQRIPSDHRTLLELVLDLWAFASSVPQVSIVSVILAADPRQPLEAALALVFRSFLLLHSRVLETGAEEEESWAEMDAWWSLVVELVQAQAVQTYGHSDGLLYVALDQAPLVVVERLAREFPAAAAFPNNHNNNTNAWSKAGWPLHRACQQRPTAVPSLLAAAPHVAQYRQPSTGRLPLHLLATAPARVSALVVRAHPQAVTTIDPVSGLDPFLWYAQCNAPLDCIWELLVAAPALMQRRVPPES